MKAARSNPLSPAIGWHQASSPSDITPRQLAMALTVLEVEQYLSLFPADYIRHLLHSPSPGNIATAADINSRICRWVKMSVLMPEQYPVRAEVLKFFINTALVSFLGPWCRSPTPHSLIVIQECRELGNFSSVVAIVVALQSQLVTQLKLTRREVDRHQLRKLEKLETLMSDAPHHRPYHEALAKSSKSCLPYIGKVGRQRLMIHS